VGIGVLAIVIGILGIVSILPLVGTAPGILLLVLGGVITIGLFINLIMRCNDPDDQKWLQGEDGKTTVELPENYKRYRRNMGDEDSEGEVVVTSGSSETELGEVTVTGKKNTTKTEKADTIVNIKSILEKDKGDEPESQKKPSRKPATTKGKDKQPGEAASGGSCTDARSS